MSPNLEPFWKDAADRPSKHPPNVFYIIATVLRFTSSLLVAAVSFFVAYMISHILAWILLAIIVMIIGLTLYFWRKRLRVQAITPQVQEKARLETGASVMGSAIHVAGHPLLAREQPVVLALAPEGFQIYSYEDNHPIDVISLDQMKELHTVSYDDERVPHTEVIDSAAQALQLSFTMGDKEFTCLFRRMLKPRPIDWFDVIQKARFDHTPQ